MDLLFSPIDLYGQYVTHLALLASSISGGEEEEGGVCSFYPPSPCLLSLDPCVVLGGGPALQRTLLFAFVTAGGG